MDNTFCKSYILNMVLTLQIVRQFRYFHSGFLYQLCINAKNRVFFYNADLNISLTSSTIFTPIFVEQIRTLVLHMLTKQGNQRRISLIGLGIKCRWGLYDNQMPVKARLATLNHLKHVLQFHSFFSFVLKHNFYLCTCLHPLQLLYLEIRHSNID